MSEHLARRVLYSDLPAHLKPVAVVMAMFCRNTEGTAIYPGVEHVAYMLSRHPRHVQRLLRQLEERAVLVPEPETRRGGRLPNGRGRSTVYQLNVDALPARPAYQPGKGDVDVTVKGDADVTVEGVTPASRTVTSTSFNGDVHVPNGDVHVTRSERGTEKSTEKEEPLRGIFSDEGEDEDQPEEQTAEVATMTKDPLPDPPRPLSDDEQLRRRREEWKQNRTTLDIKQLQDEARRLADEARRKKAEGDDER
jgi:hypothetical protein